MPYTRTRKRYTRKRKVSKAKRKMIVAPRIGKSIKQPVHYFTRYADFGTVTTTANQSFTTGSIFVEPNTDIPGWSEFVALYDSYKINAIKVKFIPLSNVSEGTTLIEHFYRFLSCIDYNDRSAPTNLNTIREYSNCRMTPNQRIHKRYYKPNFTVDVENSDFPGTFPNRYKPWLNTSAADVEHFGLKYGFEHANQATVMTAYRVELKLYMSFKARK